MINRIYFFIYSWRINWNYII